MPVSLHPRAASGWATLSLPEFEPLADSAVARLTERLLAAEICLATAESCTGGLISTLITNPPGASRVFAQGFITYSNAAKTRLLGVPESEIRASGAVSEPVAAAMALGALDSGDAGLALSVSGIAGPGGSEFKPEGRVCFGLALRGRGPALAATLEFGAIGRAHLRMAAAITALNWGAAQLEAPARAQQPG